MTEQEAIEIGKNKLLPCLEGVYWKGQKEHPEKTELIQALQHLLQIAERAGDVVGMEKEIDNIIHYKDYPACSKYMNLPVWDKERIALLLSEWLKGERNAVR